MSVGEFIGEAIDNNPFMSGGIALAALAAITLWARNNGWGQGWTQGYGAGESHGEYRGRTGESPFADE